jgi:serine/threonine-protein kinase
MPHDAAERVCPTTGRRIGTEVARTRTPPPGSVPAPVTRPKRDEKSFGGGTVAPTRNLQREFIGQTLGGRYIVKGILGEGGMGTVYDAEHLGLGRPVAIKVLNPTQAKKKVAVKRFQQEARAAGAIGHPNICEVYDMGLLDDGSPYLVMEKLVGHTLADRISREGGLPFDEVVEVMVQVLSGLIAAHEKGIVHRDIKPENILLAQRVGLPPIAKILDFGVSKMLPQFLSAGEEALDLTRTGMVMGTPYYMSPEQARGERNLDGRVDVYATGVMMYEALVGKRPYLAPNYNALLLSIINTMPLPIRDQRPATPVVLEQIVARAMAKARDDRYPSALHMLRDLQSVQRAKVPPPPTAAERARAPVVGGSATGQSPAARLRSRMSEARPPDSDPRSSATRLDIRKPDSIEIPIHITGSDLPAMPGSSDGDEVPTEIFRPGMPLPVPRGRAAPAPPPPPPQLPSLEVPADDWDGETVVRSPAALQPRPRRPFNPDETMKVDSAEIEIDFGDDTQIAPPRRR